MNPSFIEKIIAHENEKWKECTNLPETTLLRLSILRTLVQNLHTEKSRCLATGLKADAQLIRTWENHLELLQKSSKLTGELFETIQQSKDVPKKNRVIPEALFQRLNREKFERYDRKWEAVLVAEAMSLNWQVWTLEAWVNIPLIKEWDVYFTQKLWPQGIVLFVESAEEQVIDSQNHSEKNCWRGRWVVVLHPRIKTEHDLSFSFNHWPGAPDPAPPSPPRWTLIYP